MFIKNCHLWLVLQHILQHIHTSQMYTVMINRLGDTTDCGIVAPARSPPLTHLSLGLSVRSTDGHSPGWDCLLAHYWDCTAPEKRVRSKLHYVLLISRFWLRSIVAKVFDSIFDCDLIIFSSLVNTATSCSIIMCSVTLRTGHNVQ